MGTGSPDIQSWICFPEYVADHMFDIFPYAPWCWNIYQHLPHKWPSFVGKYTIHGAFDILVVAQACSLSLTSSLADWNAPTYLYIHLRPRTQQLQRWCPTGLKPLSKRLVCTSLGCVLKFEWIKSLQTPLVCLWPLYWLKWPVYSIRYSLLSDTPIWVCCIGWLTGKDDFPRTLQLAK